jgi:hypothetical protein
MWVIIAGLISFALTFFLTIRKLNSGVSLLTGAIVLGLMTLSVQSLGETILNTLSNSTTIELMASVILIASFGFLYEETGKLNEMTENLEKIISDNRMITMAVPALFGMLPRALHHLAATPLLHPHKRVFSDKDNRCLSPTHTYSVNYDSDYSSH